MRAYLKKIGKAILKGGDIKNMHGTKHHGLPVAPGDLYTQKKKEIGFKRTIQLGDGGKRGTVFIDKWTYYGNAEFNGFHTNDTLQIGAFCSLAANVRFYLCSGHHYPERISNYPLDIYFASVRSQVHKNFTAIGNDVWVGANAVILPGIRVGNGAIIAAGSIVNKDVPAYAIVGGNPAKFIRWRFEDERIRRSLQEIAWWEWGDESIKQRWQFFEMAPEQAVDFAYGQGWVRASDIPEDYFEEIGDVFQLEGMEGLEKEVRRFFYMDDTAQMLNRHKSLSYGNIAVLIAALRSHNPRCIIELGTQTGCSSSIIARLCRYLGIKPRIVTVNIRDEHIYTDEIVEYVYDDFTEKAKSIWEKWNPDIIFHDAHMYYLIKNILDISEREHRHTLHLFHDMGYRLFVNPMQIPLDAVPTSATGSWERHVLARYSENLLINSSRHFEDQNVTIHIFDSCADHHEYGMGLLKFRQ